MEGATLCVIQASQVWELGQVPLPRVESVEGQEPGCEWRFSVSGGTCPVDLGQTYVVETFSGHLAKFRISNYQLKGFEPEFEIAIQWVYQPNERPDFASP